MAMKGHRRLAWQLGTYALFAEVELSAEIRSDASLELPENVDRVWTIGAQFGVEVFRGAVLQRKGIRHGVHVRIERLSGQAVDTTATAVAYVVFHAVGQALGIEDSRCFEFDDVSGRFCVTSCPELVTTQPEM